jgi:hypothetical protein
MQRRRWCVGSSAVIHRSLKPPVGGCIHCGALARVNDILLTRSLRAQGFDSHEITRMRRRGELVTLRRGAYGRDRPDDLTAEQAHRDLIMATIPQLSNGAAISHASAAVLHGLPTWTSSLDRVHVTRDRSGGGRRRSVVHVNGAPLRSQDLAEIDAVPVTSLARTVLDLARSLPMDQAVAAGDRALAIGLDAGELQRGLQAMEFWPGVRRARRTVEFLDGRSESPGESVSRVKFAEEGVPRPDLQHEILGPDGRIVARVDFLWDEQKTVGEFDGKVKYGRLLKPGQSSDTVVFEEKVREDALRDLGWQVVRWLWRDVYRKGVLRERLDRAFARSGRVVTTSR